MTGVLPVSGVGARISGSTPAGGHSTPSDFASLSLSGSARWPVVVPCGAMEPSRGIDSIGAQLFDVRAGGVAVCAGGVIGVGGACALAAPETAIMTHERKSDCFSIRGNRRRARKFRTKSTQAQDLRYRISEK
jgi:hypothetical protein